MPIPANFDSGKFLAAIDEIPTLRSTRVLFYDGMMTYVVRPRGFA